MLKVIQALHGPAIDYEAREKPAPGTTPDLQRNNHSRLSLEEVEHAVCHS
ncbi:MAG: hypothetical protein Ct9H300mP16_00060 [Pseudomonadota bacterium]|nr:MAG: hypothetical protein Ct9H300mP16_00060 [Pseudomonadota bacterium]